MKNCVSVVMVVVCFLMVGCSSVPKRMGAIPGKQYKVVGRGEANGGGFMLLGFIPIMQNDKVQRTYDAAVRQRNGDDLINITLSESWFWAYIGNGYRTAIEGDVIKYIK